MTGMLLSGSDPLYAAIYQFVVIAMIRGRRADFPVEHADDPQPRVLGGGAVGVEREFLASLLLGPQMERSRLRVGEDCNRPINRITTSFRHVYPWPSFPLR